MSGFGTFMSGQNWHPFGLAVLIPGYLGYAQRDSRKDADAGLRKHIVDQLISLNDRLLTLRLNDISTLAEADLNTLLDRIADIKRKVSENDSLVDSFFAADSFPEVEVESLHAYDHKILETMARLERSIQTGAAGRTLSSPELLKLMDDLEELVEQRRSVLRRLGGH